MIDVLFMVFLSVSPDAIVHKARDQLRSDVRYKGKPSATAPHADLHSARQKMPILLDGTRFLSANVDQHSEYVHHFFMAGLAAMSVRHEIFYI
jgi:hypothetical protein